MSDLLRLTRAHADAMINHSLAGRPNEACGLLASRDGPVVKVIPMTNAAASPVRYALDPKEQFDVQEMLEREGLELAGVFHSHTRTEAYPSPTDVRLATEAVPYVIVSIAEPAAQIRAFRITKDRWDDPSGTVTEVSVEIDG